jgi:predicted anti-sigma-YlaC factor YlaD
MSATSCDLVRQSAPDFALGALTGRERADIVAHLDNCPSCQTVVGEYAIVADSLLELVPEADPAGDVGAPVLAAMRPAARQPRRPRWRHRVATLAAAAIAAIGLATGITVAVVSQGGDGSTPRASSVLRSAPMVGSGNVTVGRVVTTNDRLPTVAVSVDYWLPDGSYQVAARDRAGAATPVGTLDVTNGRGTWTGSTAAADHPVAITLVDESGTVVCEGQLA